MSLTFSIANAVWVGPFLLTIHHLTCKLLYKLHLLYYITSHYCFVLKQFHSNLLPPLFACSHTWFTLMVVFVERFNNRQ